MADRLRIARIRFTVAGGPLATAAVFAAAAMTFGCNSARSDAQDALTYDRVLADSIGARPVGSEGNSRARGYLTRELVSLGFKVRTQTQTVDGTTLSVNNIIATVDGDARDGTALIAHYDTVPEGPGAADDGAGVSIVLEAARSLVRSRLRHSLFVILTDGEEAGLLGARAAITDPDLVTRVQAFMNFDAGAGTGPMWLWEAYPGIGTPLDAWAASRVPHGSSLLSEIVGRLPIGTDAQVFARIAPGLSFASAPDVDSLHTARDTSDRVSTSTLESGILTAVAVVRQLDVGFAVATADGPTFFDVLGRWGVSYGRKGTLVVDASSLALAALAWVVLSGRLSRRDGRYRYAVLTWWLTLPLWSLGVLVCHWYVPRAAYLLAIPLISASAALLVIRHQKWSMRVVPLVALAATGVLWSPDLIRVLLALWTFSAANGDAMSRWVGTGFVCVPAAMLVPPMAALLAGWRADVVAR